MFHCMIKPYSLTGRMLVLLLGLLMSACSAFIAPTTTPTPTATPSATATVTLTATATYTPSVTPSPTATATITLTPTHTATATLTPLPTTTPYPVANYTMDNWEFVAAPPEIMGGLTVPYLAYLNLNDRDDVGAAALTPQPGTGVQTLYYLDPALDRTSRLEILTLPESSANHLYVSPTGDALVYFIEPGESEPMGLYLLDLITGVRARILELDSLVQRGIFSVPTWSPDGRRFALTLGNGYATDIFLFDRDGSPPQNITSDGSFNRFPQFSPDGTRLAFVSDRAICPSWFPNQPNTCDRTDTLPPDGGHLYVVNVDDATVEAVTTTYWLTEPPTWITNDRLSFSQGQPAFGDPNRSLVWVDLVTGQITEVNSSAEQPYLLNERWSPDGELLVYQAAGNTTSIVIADASGTVLNTTNEFNYPRFGSTFSWALNSNRLAMGGTNGQCPYGVTVVDTTLQFITRSNPAPSMCNPLYAPNGLSIAFTGISLNQFDGRSDIYIAGENGTGARNLTGDLRGQFTLLGWVGGQ